MIGFTSLGRWRPEAFLAAADHLEDGRTVPHFGHLYDVPTVVDALRHTAGQVEAARCRAIETAERIVAHGWRFTTASGEVVVQGSVATAVTWEEFDRIEDLMGTYGADMAVALTDVERALDDLYAVIQTARRDPGARARPRIWRPLRPESDSRARRRRRRDLSPWCRDR